VRWVCGAWLDSCKRYVGVGRYWYCRNTGEADRQTDVLNFATWE
jgi:hypothetical protein